MEIIEIGGTPANEACAATGRTEDYLSLNRLECRAYIAALRQVYGAEPEGAELHTRSHAHDFGTYCEVALRYDPELSEARAYAARVEAGLKTWFEAGFWPPVTYDDHSQALHVIRDPKAWLAADNPEAHASLQPTEADPPA